MTKWYASFFLQLNVCRQIDGAMKTTLRKKYTLQFCISCIKGPIQWSKKVCGQFSIDFPRDFSKNFIALQYLFVSVNLLWKQTQKTLDNNINALVLYSALLDTQTLCSFVATLGDGKLLLEPQLPWFRLTEVIGLRKFGFCLHDQFKCACT